MPDMRLVFVASSLLGLGAMLLLGGCQNHPKTQPRNIKLSQTWALQPGDSIGGYRVSGSLGDISIHLKGKPVYAPFSGLVQPYQDCVVFSSSEVPAYLFRLCGLKRPKLGEVQQGEAIGSSDYLEFAALRKQPNGTWAFVEPSKAILERTLQRS